MPVDITTLNGPQRQAVECTEGPLLVLAGAGSGKTRVLTYRIAHILEDLSVAPWEILAITFTNKAANELKERLTQMLGTEALDVWAMTFHSACCRILRREIDRLDGYTGRFTIYDTSDSERVMKDILKDFGLDEKSLPPRLALSVISKAKDKRQGPEQFSKHAGKSGDYRMDTNLHFHTIARNKKKNVLNVICVIHKYPHARA